MARTQPREKKISVRLHDINFSIDYHLQLALEYCVKHYHRRHYDDDFYLQRAEIAYDIAREVAGLADARCSHYQNGGWPLFDEWKTWVRKTLIQTEEGADNGQTKE